MGGLKWQCIANCHDFGGKGHFAFFSPFGNLGTTYDDHLRLIEKRVVDFLLVLIELFFARCYDSGARSDYRFKIGDFVPTGPVDPKFQLKVVAPPTILLLRQLG